MSVITPIVLAGLRAADSFRPEPFAASLAPSAFNRPRIALTCRSAATSSFRWVGETTSAQAGADIVVTGRSGRWGPGSCQTGVRQHGRDPARRDRRRGARERRAAWRRSDAADARRQDRDRRRRALVRRRRQGRGRRSALAGRSRRRMPSHVASGSVQTYAGNGRTTRVPRGRQGIHRDARPASRSGATRAAMSSWRRTRCRAGTRRSWRVRAGYECAITARTACS